MKIVPLSAFKDNYIWTLCTADLAVVVDPGDSAPVEAFLAESGRRLGAILLTHHHADHIGGVPALLDRHAVPVMGPADPRIPMVTHEVKDGDCFKLEGFADAFQVLAVPGHTESHIAFLHGNALFCGDTLFSAGCGRLLGGTAEQLHASLNRIAALPDDTLVCCTHEYTLSNLRFARAVEPANPAITARLAACEALRATSRPTLPVRLGDERGYNPFLRCSVATVKDAAQAETGMPLESPLAVFAALRRWKDGFA